MRPCVLLILILVFSLSAQGKPPHKRKNKEKSEPEPKAILEIKGADKSKSYSMKELSDGVAFKTFEPMTIVAHGLFDRQIHFSGNTPAVNEYTFLFPSAVVKKKGLDAVWVQLLFDYSTDIVECDGCLEQVHIRTIETNQNSLNTLMAFPLANDRPEVRIRVLADTSGADSKGLVMDASGVVVGNQIMYLKGNSKTQARPQSPVLFLASQQQHDGDGAKTELFMKDRAVMVPRPESAPYAPSKPWLALERQPLTGQQKALLNAEAFNSAEGDLDTLAQLKKLSLRLTLEADSYNERVRDAALEKIGKQLIDLKKRINTTQRVWPALMKIAIDINPLVLSAMSAAKLQGKENQTPQESKQAITVGIAKDYYEHLQQLSALVGLFSKLVSPLLPHHQLPWVKSWTKEHAGDLVGMGLKLHQLTWESYVRLPDLAEHMRSAKGQEAKESLSDGALHNLYHIIRVFPLLDILFSIESVVTNRLVLVSERQSLETLFIALTEHLLDQFEQRFSRGITSEAISSAPELDLFPYLLRTTAILLLPNSFQRLMEVLHGCRVYEEASGQLRLNRSIVLDTDVTEVPLAQYIFTSPHIPGKPVIPTTFVRIQEEIDVRLQNIIDGKAMTHLDWQLIRLKQNNFGLNQSFFDIYGSIRPNIKDSNALLETVVLRYKAEDVLSELQAGYYQEKLEREEDSLVMQQSMSDELQTVFDKIQLDASALPPDDSEDGEWVGNQKDLSDSDSWLYTTAEARKLLEAGLFQKARDVYQKSLLLLGDDDQSKSRRAHIAVELGDTWLTPWRQLYHNLYHDLAFLRQFQKRVDALDEQGIAKLSAEYGQPGFLEYRALVRSRSPEEQRLLDIPEHRERLRFWQALKRVRDALQVSERDIQQAVSHYQKALASSGHLSEAEDGLYRKIVQQLHVFIEQKKEAEAFVSHVAGISGKLIRVLKITGTYKTSAGQASSGGYAYSWKTRLVQDVARLAGHRNPVRAREMNVYRHLQTAGLSQQFEWALVHKSDLVAKEQRAPDEQVTWQWRLAGQEGTTRMSPVTWLHLGRDGKKSHIQTADAAAVDNAILMRNHIRRVLNTESSPTILACRSQNSDELCRELDEYEYFATPVRWLGMGGK